MNKNEDSRDHDHAIVERIFNDLMKSPKVSLSELFDRAKHGSIWSVYYIGECYRLGKGVKRNLQEAANLYIQSANRGHLLSAYRMAWMAKTTGQSQKAIEWYKYCADDGDPPSMNNL